MPSKERRQGVSSSLGSSVKTCIGPTHVVRVAVGIGVALDLSRELLKSCHVPLSEPDLDQPLQLLVNGIRRKPEFLRREVSKPEQWVHRDLVVQGSHFDRCDVALNHGAQDDPLRCKRKIPKPRPRSGRNLQQWVVNRCQKGLTGDLKHQILVHSEKKVHMRERAAHAKRQSHRLQNCQMRARGTSPRECTPMSSRKTYFSLKT